MRFLLPATVLWLAACAPAPAPLAWNIQTSATAGTALVYQEGQTPSVHFACRRNPVDFLVSAGFSAEAGDPPLIVRSGGTELVLPTSAIPGGSKAVEARIPMSPAVYALLESDAPITLSYGKQVRSIPASDGGLRDRFLSICRG